MLFGCDVASVDHDKIYYRRLKDSGRSFLIPRGEFGNWIDPDFMTHYHGALDAGMVSTGYCFPDFSKPIEPQAEAFFKLLDDNGYPTANPGVLAPCFDLERTDNQDRKMVVEKTRIWGEMARDHYGKDLPEYRSELYSSDRVLELETLHGIDLSPLVPLFDLWLAYYGGPTVTPPVPFAWGGNGKANGTGPYLLHQYGGDASGVPGVSGKIDVDLFCSMQMGSPKSAIVMRLQSMLNRIMKPSVPLAVDGLFGDKTRRVLVSYQASRGLQQDGVCGVYTWAKIIWEK